MSKPILVLLFVPFLFSCKVPRRDIIVYHLSSDFAYAEQAPLIRARKPAFQLLNETLKGKRYPCFHQDQAGAISFAVALGKQPVLTYALNLLERRASDLDLSVTVESDFPAPMKQEFRAQIGAGEISLGEFENRIVKITFLGRNRQSHRLGGSLLWIDPTIRQVADRSHRTNPPNNASLVSFRERHKKDNVLIFLFDAMNASHLGCYGYTKPTSPVIDSLAAEGVLWETAVSQAVSTLASTGSLFTGLYPDAHGVLIKPSALQDRFKTMAEYFLDAGYETALFSANPNASPVFGYGQGFKRSWNLRRGGAVFAGEFVSVVNSWLSEVRRKPFFGYVHFREPHEPYSPPSEILAQFHDDPNFRLPVFDPFVEPAPEDRGKIIAAYDANLAYGDRQLGKILGHLKLLGLIDNTIIIVLSDHGEAFWHHGKQGHNYQVYEETVRIPLITVFPREPQMKGIRKSQMVGSIDLMPTFLDLFPFSQKGVRTHGRSFLPLLFENGGQEERFLISQTSSKAVYGLRSQEFKLVFYPTRREPEHEFYALSSDPFEKSNRIREYSSLSSYYRVQLQKTLRELERFRSSMKVGEEQKAVIDRETEEELQALGYVN